MWSACPNRPTNSPALNLTASGNFTGRRTYFGTNCTGFRRHLRLVSGMGSELMIRVVAIAAGAFTVAAVSVLLFSS